MLLCFSNRPTDTVHPHFTLGLHPPQPELQECTETKDLEVYCSSFQPLSWKLKIGLYSQHFICKTPATCKAPSRVISETCFLHNYFVAALESQPGSGPLFWVLWKFAVSYMETWSWWFMQLHPHHSAGQHLSSRWLLLLQDYNLHFGKALLTFWLLQNNAHLLLGAFCAQGGWNSSPPITPSFSCTLFFLPFLIHL